MEPKAVQVVPAGKKPKVKKKPSRTVSVLKKIKLWLKANKLRCPHYLLAASLFLVSALVFYNYMNSFVYVVLMDDREVGIVKNAGEFETFVADLTERCGDLYGMHMEPGKKIALVKEFRPGSSPETETVQTAVRQQMTLRTDAHMIKIDGAPLVPVNSEAELNEIVTALKSAYISNHSSARLLDSVIVEDLTLEPCSVSPDNVYTAEEVVRLLVDSDNTGVFQAAALTEPLLRGSLDNRHNYAYINSASLVHSISEDEYRDNHDFTIESNGVSVKTREEVVVEEDIPFTTEYIYDEEMWTVEHEVETPGQEGKKEITYHITRENGVEVARTKINEETVEEPVTQVEKHGTAKVPSIGSGRFIWPVENGGAITPGRGFSAWHTGIDINAPAGTNILAADSGIVWFSGRGGSQGNYIIIYHGSYWSLYLHNEVNLVSEGDQVEKGEVIGRVGSTGRSSGPHLHFEIRLDDGTGEWHGYYQHKPIDPLRFFNP